MAEKLLKVKGVFDPGDVQTGLQALTANMREMGKASLEVGGSKEAWNALGKSIETMRPDLANVATVAYETAKAMDGIGRAGANFGQIEAGVGKATGYLKILKDAMAEAERAGVEIGPAVKQSIETMERGIAGAAEKAKTLRTSFEGVGKPAAEGAKDVDALGRALANLEKAADSPRRLGMAAAMAKVELDEAREAAQKAGTVTAEMGERFASAESKIEAATNKSRQFADTAGDLKTKGDLAAKGFESMAAGAGSLEGMLGKLKDTGTSTQQKMADIGFAGIGMAGAFSAGYGAGEKLDQGMKGLGLDLSKAGDGFAKNAARVLDLGLAMGKAVPIGETNRRMLQDLKNVTEEYSNLLGPLPGKLNPILQALHANQAAAAAAADGAKKFGVTLLEAGNEATKLEQKTKYIEDFFDAHSKGKDKVENLQKAIESNASALLAERDAWIADGKAITDMSPKMQEWIKKAEEVDAARKKNIESMQAAKQAAQEVIDADAKKKLAEDDEIKRLNELADRVAHGTATQEELAKAIGKVAEKHKVSVALIQESMKSYEKAALEINKYIKGLGEMADKVNVGRASHTDLEKEIKKTAEATGKSVEEVRRLVAAKADEIAAFKEARPVYENAAEANEQYADTIRDIIKEMDDLAAAREREHKAMYDAAQGETDARAQAAEAGGGPVAWLKDIDGAKEKVRDLGKTIEGLAGSWTVAREAVVAYQGQLREASDESMKLDGNTNKFLDTITKIAGQNDKTSAWIKQYIDELQRAMQVGEKGYFDMTKVIDDFMNKVRGTHDWMKAMNAEFVLGDSFYGDVERDFYKLATAADSFKQSLVGK